MGNDFQAVVVLVPEAEKPGLQVQYLYRIGHDQVQHLLEVQGGADGLGYVYEGLEIMTFDVFHRHLPVLGTVTL